MNPDSPQHLYRWFDADDQLLYVGISTNAYQRAKSHKRSSVWWPEASQMTLEVFSDRASVCEAEKEAIQKEKPKYNIQYKVKVKKPKARKPEWWRDHDHRTDYGTFEFAEAGFYETLFHPRTVWYGEVDPIVRAELLRVWNSLPLMDLEFKFLYFEIRMIASEVLRLDARRRVCWEEAQKLGFLSGDYPVLTFKESIAAVSDNYRSYEDGKALMLALA